MLTFLPMSEIRELEKLEGQEINKAKEILAYEVTALVHGKDEADKVQNVAKAIFCSGQNTDDMPSTEISLELFVDEKISVIDLLMAAKLVSSKGEARRLIEQGGISILLKDETRKIKTINESLSLSDFEDNFVVVKKGKKVFQKVCLSSFS